MLLLLINLAAGASAATIYSLCALRWWREKAYLLAAFCALSVLAAIMFTVGYTLIVFRLVPVELVFAYAFRPAVGLILIFPALARLLEYRRAQRHEAVVRKLASDLQAQEVARE